MKRDIFKGRPRWRRIGWMCLLPALAVGAALDASPAATGPATATRDGVAIAVAPDRPTGLYKVGEKASFTIRATRDGKPVDDGEVGVKTEVVGGGKDDIHTEKVKLAHGEATVVREFAAAGNMMVEASYAFDKGKPVVMEAGAVASPETLKPGLAAPDDFDAFWDAQKKLLADEPMKPQLTPVAAPQGAPAEKIECFDVQINCPGGAPVSGYFARPKGAKPKSLPAMISFHGAGVRSSALMGPAMCASIGRLAMDINAHGIPNGKPAEFYAKLQDGELKSYAQRGLESRDTCYFRGMYLRLMRAMDFLEAQPEWDGRILMVQGGSQGGGQSLAAAGLDPRVTLVSISVPAMCDLGGQEAGRPSGWPIRKDKLDAKQLQTLRYFDACNFAARIKATTVVRIALADRTCWPTSSLAMVAQLKGPKFVVTSPAAMHMFTPTDAYKEADDLQRKIFAEQVAAAKKE